MEDGILDRQWQADDDDALLETKLKTRFLFIEGE